MITTKSAVVVGGLTVALAGCGAAAAQKSAAPPRAAVTITHTVTQSPVPQASGRRHHHAAAASPAAPEPAPANPAANSEAVVDQFYTDITNQDYAGAWALGGSNLAAANGQSYSNWVGGYSTTASLTLGTGATWNGPTVTAELVATQDDGAVQTYSGTYTVENGIIQSADIVRAG